MADLVTPGNPQCCNSMTAERSIQLYFFVGLLTSGDLFSGKQSIRKLKSMFMACFY